MGYVINEMLIVTFNDYALREPWMPDVEAFRTSMPEEFRPLLVGPIRSVVNGDLTYVFAPDGSKYGWDGQETGSDLRQRFADLFSYRHRDGSTPFDVVRLRYGGDFAHDSAPQVEDLNPRNGPASQPPQPDDSKD